MKKGERYTGTVEKTAFPNRGKVTADGETAVVKNALPGQVVEFVVSKKRNGRCEGRLLKVVQESPLETAADRCPHFGVCGGCTYQSLPYETQVRLKEAQVRELLEPVCSLEVFEGIKPSPLSEGYRNKMEFSFGDEEKGGPLALGLHRRGSFHDVVNVDGCRIVHPDFTEILKATREYFAAEGLSFYKKLQHQGYLRHLLVRRAVKTGEILAALVTSGQTGAASPEAGGSPVRRGLPLDAEDERLLLAGWRDMLLKLPLSGRFAGILHIRNDSLADVVQSDETTVLYGQDFFYEELLGLRFQISPFSFFQTNSLGAEKLYETVREYVGDTRGKVVFDLYSGTGTIAQLLAPVAERVVGVEIVAEAVEAARVNAAGNGLTNCEFIAGDVMKVLANWMDGPQDFRTPDIIVLDPPRDGIHPKALDRIGGQIQAKRIIYISCQPVSLARDLEKLAEYGYVPERICCVDMFPSTCNIETACLLTKSGAWRHIEAGPKMDEMDATAAEKKTGHEEPEE